MFECNPAQKRDQYLKTLLGTLYKHWVWPAFVFSTSLHSCRYGFSSIDMILSHPHQCIVLLYHNIVLLDSNLVTTEAIEVHCQVHEAI